MKAFGVVIFPLSWQLGIWNRPKKSILAIGPLRFVVYHQPGDWKPEPFDLRDNLEGPGMM